MASVWKRNVVAIGWCLLSLAKPVAAQETPALGADTKPAESPPAEAPPAPNNTVAATVNGMPIYVGEIDVAFDAVQKSGRLGRQDPNRVKAQMLAQLVDRRVASQALAKDTSLYTEEEIDQKMEPLREAAAKQGTTLEELVAQRGLSFETLRQDVMFQVAVDRYLRKLLPTVLPTYLNEHKAEFDGTEIRASHILLRPASFAQTSSKLEEQAETIREEIESGKLDFAAAAKKYSQAPSAERGGDIGFIPRHGAMLEPFSAALFKLKPGEVSPPVATNVGIHLIQAGEVKPGTKDLKESLPQIQQQAAAEVLKDFIDQQRANAKIEFTGNTPYFKPGTEELVTP